VRFDLGRLDHPFLFIFAITFAVFAMAKVIAYASGKVGLPVVAEFFAPGSTK
jgi:hypothetical protein